MTRSNGQEDSMPIGTPAYLRALDSNGRPVRVTPSTLPTFVSGSSIPVSLDTRFIATPKDFSASAGTGGDDTLAVQLCIDYGITNSTTVNLHGIWRVTKLVINNPTFKLVEFQGSAVFVGISSITQTCVLEILSGGWINSGKLSANGSYSENYAAGIWVHSTTALQHQNFGNIGMQGTNGLRIGDAAYPGALISEITFDALDVYGCPTPLIIEGRETYVTFTSPCCISADAFGGDAPWQAKPRHALTNIGATVTVIGGELIQTASTLITDHLIIQKPAVSGANIQWGRTALIGVVIESAGPLAKIDNPGGLSATVADRPYLTFGNCVGFHSQDLSELIDVASGFPGDVRWDGSTLWCPVARTQNNIICRGTAANVYVDERGFGLNFKGYLAGTSGGIRRFAYRQILKAVGLPNSGLATGALLFTATVNDDDLAGFTSSYNTGTGEFTVPNGGLREFNLYAQVYAPGVTGFLIIRLNGATELGRSPFVDRGGVTFQTYNLSAGLKITVELNITAGAGTLPSASGFQHYLSIQGSR